MAAEFYLYTEIYFELTLFVKNNNMPLPQPDIIKKYDVLGTVKPDENAQSEIQDAQVLT